MNNNKTIDVLNSLIEINQDRIEGYQTATDETNEIELKGLFSTLMRTSEECKDELTAEVLRLGGTPQEGTRNTGKIFRVWMDFKAALTGKDRKAILNSCEFGEDAAVEAYEKVLEDHREDLNYDQTLLVRKQYKLIKNDHDEIRSLRDQFQNA